MYAICFTKEGTTLTFWLNRYSWGGFIWSLVRSSALVERQKEDGQYWNQPPLRFDTVKEGQEFIQSQLAGNPEARVAQVVD
ncbi:MAG: hypothetical protein ACHQX3_11465 [Nitrospirales bacterium]